MTSIFQVLVDFLDFLISPIYNLLYTVWGFVNNLLLQLLWSLCRAFCFIANGVISGFSYAIDTILVCMSSALSSIAPSGGLFGHLGAGNTSLVSQAANYGAYGITWVQNFVDVSRIFTPLVTYLTFLICWTVYKIIKSWIPTVSGSG